MSDVTCCKSAEKWLILTTLDDKEGSTRIVLSDCYDHDLENYPPSMVKTELRFCPYCGAALPKFRRPR